MLDIEQTIKENKRRLTENGKTYDPITGEGSVSIPRQHFRFKDTPLKDMWLPTAMLEHDVVKQLIKYKSIDSVLKRHYHIQPTSQNYSLFWKEFVKLRCRYDFEYWAAMFFFIKDKKTAKRKTFRMKRVQRELDKRVESQRAKTGMIRVIIDKARQMGLSTYVCAKISWLQLCVHRQWNSVTCAHVENTARVIRGMFTRNLKTYPAWMIDDNLIKVEDKPYEGSNKTRWIPSRECRFSVGSSEAPDSLRGEDVMVAHLSEVGLWKSTEGKKPEDLVESIVSSIPHVPDSAIFFESTAKGVGNFFHREWLRFSKENAEDEEGGYIAVFLAWFFDDDYALPVKDYKSFIESLTQYEEYLFNLGATLEAIAWYRKKSKGFSSEWRFKSEFPSTDVESFQSSGNRFYPVELTQKLRQGCCPPKFIGEVVGNKTLGEPGALEGLKFKRRENGKLKVWELPAETVEVTNRYIVVVDIGGRSEKADRSVICVFDRYWMSEGDVPEIVAEWSGHTEHYKVAWLAAQISKFYHNALLVIESNTYEMEGTEGQHFEFIMDEIAEYYDNMYIRGASADKIREGMPVRYGWQTNHSNKTMVCDFMLKQLDTNPYLERCSEAVDEFETFEVQQNGKLNAVEGCHDDRHITRVIGLWICYKEKAPVPVQHGAFKSYSKTIVGEASI